MRDRSRIALCSIRATNLPMCQAISLPNATRAGPGLPAIQHLAEFTDGGGRSFVSVSGNGGAKPIRLRVAARSASLGTPFAGLEIAREIAGRIRDPEQHDQCDDTLHHWLRPFSQDFCAAIEARSRLDRAQTGARLIPQGRANCRVTSCRTVVHIYSRAGRAAPMQSGMDRIQWRQNLLACRACPGGARKDGAAAARFSCARNQPGRPRNPG